MLDFYLNLDDIFILIIQTFIILQLISFGFKVLLLILKRKLKKMNKMKNKKDPKIENNRVICKCGTDLGEFEEGKVYFCKECLRGIGFINTYFSIKPEDIFGDNLERMK